MAPSVRHDGRSSVQIRVSPDQVANGQVKVWIASAYLREEDVALIRVDGGRIIQAHLDKSRLTVDDILEAAREKPGLERMAQVKCAVLERTGFISIIPRPDAA